MGRKGCRVRGIPGGLLDSLGEVVLAGTLRRADARAAVEPGLQWAARQSPVTRHVGASGAGTASTAAARGVTDTEVVAIAAAAVRTISTPATVRRARISGIDARRPVALILCQAEAKATRKARMPGAADKITSAGVVDATIAGAAVVPAIARRFRLCLPHPQAQGESGRACAQCSAHQPSH